MNPQLQGIDEIGFAGSVGPAAYDAKGPKTGRELDATAPNEVVQIGPARGEFQFLIGKSGLQPGEAGLLAGEFLLLAVAINQSP